MSASLLGRIRRDRGTPRPEGLARIHTDEIKDLHIAARSARIRREVGTPSVEAHRRVLGGANGVACVHATDASGFEDRHRPGLAPRLGRANLVGPGSHSSNPLPPPSPTQRHRCPSTPPRCDDRAPPTRAAQKRVSRVVTFPSTPGIAKVSSVVISQFEFDVALGTASISPTKEGTTMSATQVTKAFKAHEHTRQAISLRGLRAQIKRADGINAKVAVFLTNIVGSMWCAYAFAIIAFIGLPAALKPGGEGIISWIAQTFLQLVLLSVIMVGQNVQAVAGDVRSQRTYDDTVQILDRLDIHTQGGIKDLADRIDELEAKIAS